MQFFKLMTWYFNNSKAGFKQRLFRLTGLILQFVVVWPALFIREFLSSRKLMLNNYTLETLDSDSFIFDRYLVHSKFVNTSKINSCMCHIISVKRILTSLVNIAETWHSLLTETFSLLQLFVHEQLLLITHAWQHKRCTLVKPPQNARQMNCISICKASRVFLFIGVSVAPRPSGFQTLLMVDNHIQTPDYTDDVHG